MSRAWNSGSASDWFIKMHVLDWYKCEDNISKCMAKEILFPKKDSHLKIPQFYT